MVLLPVWGCDESGCSFFLLVLILFSRSFLLFLSLFDGHGNCASSFQQYKWLIQVVISIPVILLLLYSVALRFQYDSFHFWKTVQFQVILQLDYINWLLLCDMLVYGLVPAALGFLVTILGLFISTCVCVCVSNISETVVVFCPAKIWEMLMKIGFWSILFSVTD